ncbi:MAG: PfkB family carbohydrate kinase [Collinsella sp.]
MGVSVSAVSNVGKDEYGDKMREALAAEGLDISHLRVEDGDTCDAHGIERRRRSRASRGNRWRMEIHRPNEDDRAFILYKTSFIPTCLAIVWTSANGMMRARRLWTLVFSQDPNMHVRLIFLT